MTPLMIDDTNKYCVKEIPFLHQAGHMHKQPLHTKYKHHCMQYILRYLEKGK